ncbi:MAG: rhodanese-like domain-containing protein [Gammaproteobacteria bacterium]|nr:rhodanese-like domain-containing protein [Gammaproteobacteria bacterium]
MNTHQTQKQFEAGTHVVKPISFKAHKLIGLSDKLLVSHYENNYGGALRRLNAIEQRLADFDWQSASVFDINGIKREQLIAANSVILHEVYFDSMGEEGGEAIGDELTHAIEKYFGSVEQWKQEFTAMGKALAGDSGWVVLTWSDRFNRLTNEWANEYMHNLADATPILALDMYEHAYQIDFGSNAGAYVDAFIKNIHWGRVNERYQRALKLSGETVAEEAIDQVSVGELKFMLDHSDKKPFVLDVRHTDDRERSGERILETPWRDSHCVSEWANELPKDRPIVVYCAYGFWVSQDAAAELREHGYDAKLLEGGVAAWNAMDYPTTIIENT